MVVGPFHVCSASSRCAPVDQSSQKSGAFHDLLIRSPEDCCPSGEGHQQGREPLEKLSGRTCTSGHHCRLNPPTPPSSVTTVGNDQESHLRSSQSTWTNLGDTDQLGRCHWLSRKFQKGPVELLGHCVQSNNPTHPSKWQDIRAGLKGTRAQYTSIYLG